MRRLRFISLLISAALLLGMSTTAPAQIPQTMSYQGVLTDGAGTPVSDGTYSITFRIYTLASGGTEIWTESQSIDVSGGIFSAILGAVNPLTVRFDAPYWLGISVNGGAEYTPRTELTATGYSLNSRAVADSAVTGSGIAGGTVVRSLSGLSDDVILAAGNNVSITTSGDSLIVSSSGGSGSLDWSLTGNAGTTPGVNFIGTTDNQPLELWVNSARVLRLEPHATSPNVIGGRMINAVTAGAFGATISGGGDPTNPNTVTDNHGTVGGGYGNTAGDDDGDPTNAIDATVAGGTFNQAAMVGATVGGGTGNSAIGEHSVIGGGLDNVASGLTASVGGGEENRAIATDATVGGGATNLASGQTATVGGGNVNTASGRSSTVAGGNINTASGDQSTVAGGNFNIASGSQSTVAGGTGNAADGVGASVPGGETNIAGGGYSFAAGRNAQALHGGSFVWSDSTGSNAGITFTSTGRDQFLISASGGVGIGTNTPQQELDVAGSVRMQGFDLPTGAALGYVLTSNVTGTGSWQPAPGGSAWGLTGNAGLTPGTHFMGTTDNVAVEMRVNGERALILQPHATSPNLTGGHAANVVNASAWGQTVGGGGDAFDPNRVTDNYGTIGGGSTNQAGNDDGSPSNAGYATVAGGTGNSAVNEYTSIGGGIDNTAQGSYSVISGGNNNATSNVSAFIGGGQNNQVTGTTSVVSGGLANQATHNYTTVAGGNGNIASGLYASAGGGLLNTASGERATVSGGTQNTAQARATTVGGGEGNQTDERAGTVGGGWNNHVYGVLGTIAGGGRMNLNDGGTANRVTDNYGTVGGGGNNQAGNGPGLITDAQFATVGGGRQNLADGAQSTVAGGNFNVAGATNATVAGGTSNSALALNATVAGGASNLASGSNAAVGGGLQNQAVGNYGAIGGGNRNRIDGLYATIPGGIDNWAGGTFSFAAGRRAKVDSLHTAAFLWADGSDYDFNSAANHEFAVRATGGVRFVSAIDGSGAPTAGVELTSGSGTWASLSDRNAKENITPVDGDEILAKLSEIQISTWNYRTQNASVLHVGPMAQDFYAAFQLGEDDKHITTIDADGVSLAAIQALNRKLNRELERKDEQIESLEARLAMLEAMINRMAGAPMVTE